MNETRRLTDELLAVGVAELSQRDPHLAAVVARHGAPPLWDRPPGFETLVQIILEQQVSLASARAAYLRLLAVIGEPLPERVLVLTDDQLKKQLVARPTTYLMGELDTLPLAGFDSSCPAMAQGANRNLRGQAWGKYVNEKLGAHHTTMVVPLCGHNARCMFTSDSVLALLFPKP